MATTQFQAAIRFASPSETGGGDAKGQSGEEQVADDSGEGSRN
jgi:hypothetical protein